MIKIFSQTKTDLLKKINHYIEDDFEIEGYFKEALKKWILWFNENKDNIELTDLTNDFFYRAYHEEPNIFGIQIWEEKEDMYVWYSNLYVNNDIEENDENTIVLN